MSNLEEIQKLREETGISVMECKKALVEACGDIEKAKQILQSKSAMVAAKKADRTTKQGIIEAYIHGNGKIGVLLELSCESDFVAKNPDFKELAHDLAMQIASMDPETTEELLKQDYIKDSSLKVSDIVNSKIQKIGENIKVSKFSRYQIC